MLVPEVSTLAKGSFWAKEPAGKYPPAGAVGIAIADCCKHLSRLPGLPAVPHLPKIFSS